jgi:2-dehydropantoate 2-reductase
LRFTIIGAGGVGGCFGGALARAGHDVALYARGAHLDAIRRDGLTIRTPEETQVVRLIASDTIDDLPPADVAVVAVKSYSLADVMPAARSAAARGATVLPLLNGVTAADELAAAGVPRTNVLGGLARISAARTAPGVVERRSSFQSMVVGEIGGGLTERATAIAHAFQGAGIDARASATMEVELWQKFVFITALAAVCGMARTPIGPVRDAPGGRRLIERAVGEVVAIARARGIALPADEAERTVAYIGTLPASMKPSFLLDLESGGATELDTLSGAISRFAAEARIECPVHETAATVLRAVR